MISVKEVAMGGAFRMHGEESVQGFSGKTRRRPLRRPSFTWEDNIKMYL
jgi:hypothetical protein